MFVFGSTPEPAGRAGDVVAIVGGAVSGSVAAQILAEHGCEVVVFEQNERPYGKIEDGLPRWHTKLRRQEYEKIDERLARPNIHFVPRTRMGSDLQLSLGVTYNTYQNNFGLVVELVPNLLASSNRRVGMIPGLGTGGLGSHPH